MRPSVEKTVFNSAQAKVLVGDGTQVSDLDCGFETRGLVRVKKRILLVGELQTMTKL